jgi:hypothetical protein
MLTTIPGLGIETATLNGTSVSARGSMTQQAIKIAVTAWPIIFAAILAQSLKAYATYKVERKEGIQLMVSRVPFGLGIRAKKTRLSSN